MLRAMVKFLLLTEAFAVATYALGWWAVPLLAFAWAAFVDTRSRPVFFATLCATAAWCGVLLLDAARGPVDVVAARFGGVVGFRPIVLIATTIVFATLLAWSASSVGSALRKSILAGRAESHEPPSAPEQRLSAGEVPIADV
jgi:hypothetical protein